MSDRLVLGTVQLGMPYGISNKAGKPDFDSACDIIKTAFDRGITRFDTAQAYGDSEEVLGRCFACFGIADRVRVISKIDPSLDCRDATVMDRALEHSLKRLRLDCLSGFMLHHEKQMDDWNYGLRDWLVRQRQAGRIKAIGISVYSSVRALEAIKYPEVDFVQVPANVFDRRCEDAGVFIEADRQSKKIYIRNVFLQGLLLMMPGHLPETMSFVDDALGLWRTVVERSGLSARELALGYVMAKWSTAMLVFGAESARQVEENTRVTALDRSSELFRMVEDEIRCTDERLLQPWRWPKNL